MKTNNNGQTVLNQMDLIDGWLSGHSPNSVIMGDVEPINIYNEWCELYDIEQKIKAAPEYTKENYIENCMGNWNMPDQYKLLSIEELLLEKLDTLGYDNNSEQFLRVRQEFQEYEKRGMIIVLKFLVYLLDVCKEHNIVLGVGRGSSVASYVLFLMGIHRVDSIKYELDIKEFLK